MKSMKKLLAVVLAVCMLIGMPLSIDVSAAGGTVSDDPTSFDLVYAYPATDAMLASAKSKTSVKVNDANIYEGEALKGRILLLQFNGPVGNTYDQKTAKLWSGLRLAIEDANGTAIHSFSWYNMGSWFSGTANPFYYILKDTALTIGETTYNVTCFDDIFALMEEGGPYAGKGYKLVYRLWEQGDGADKTNGKVDAYFNSAINTLKLTANTKQGDFDCVSIEVKRVEDLPRLERVVRVDDDRLMIQFSEGINWRNGFQGVRIVDKDGRLLCYNASGWDSNAANKYDIKGSGHLQAGATPARNAAVSYVTVDALVREFGSTKLSLDAHLAAAQKEDPSAGYHYIYDLESSEWNASVCNSKRGEYDFNYVADNYWTSNGEKPLMANLSNSVYNIRDSVTAPILTMDEFKAEAADEYVFIESATEVLNETSSKIFIKFSERVSNGDPGNNRYFALRIYDKNNYLMYVTPDGTPTTATTNNTACQWSLGGFAYYDMVKWDSFVWGTGVSPKTSGPLKDAGSTAASIRAWMDSKGMTREAGYRLCISLSETETAATPAKDTKLECFWAEANKSKKLFANGNAGEERSYIEVETADYQSLQINKVVPINNNYVLIYLNQNVATLNNKVIYSAMAISSGGTALTWHNTDGKYSTAGNGTDLQAPLSLSYYGNAKNILVGTFRTASADPAKARSYPWLKQHLANAGGTNAIVLRLNDTALAENGTNLEYVLDGFAGTGGEYARLNTPNTGFNVQNYAISPSTNVDLTANSMTILDGDTVLVEFSKPVATIDTRELQVWLTKYKMANGDRMFNAYTGSGVLWQSKFNTFNKADENGKVITAAASKYWVMDLADKTALAEAAYQTKTQTEWTYGIRFEQTGNKTAADGTKTQGMIERVIAADGDYLIGNSVEAIDYRHFVELDVDSATIDPVEIVNAKVIDTHTVQVTFSRPVRHNTVSGVSTDAKGRVNVRVADEYNRVHTGYIETSSEWQPVDEDGDGYATVVNIKVTEASNNHWAASNRGVAGFASTYRNNTDWWNNGKHMLCVGFDDPNGAVVGDGYVSAVRDIYGNLLQASPYYASTGDKTYIASDKFQSRNCESALFSIEDDDYIILNTNEISVNTLTTHNGADALFVTTPPMQDVARSSIDVRVYKDTTLVKIDGQDAIWKLSSFTNYNNTNYSFVGTLVENFGCDTVAEIRAMLEEKQIEYTDVYLTVVESTDNNAKPYFGDGYLYHFDTTPHRYPLEAAIVDAENGDIALLPIGGVYEKEALHFTDLTIKKDLITGNYQFEINLSHAADTEALLAALEAADLKAWFCAKHATSYALYNTKTGEGNDDSPVQENISSAITAVSDTKLVATVTKEQYDRVADVIDASNGKAVFGFRLEDAKSPAGITGGAYVNSGFLVSTEEDVLPALYQHPFGAKKGRIWGVVTEIPVEEGAFIVNGEVVKDVTEALGSIATGDEITLLEDVVFDGENGINVAPDAVLDLNGKTLDLNGKSLVVNGHIVDSSKGNAVIKMSNDTDEQIAKFAIDNPQVPVYDTEAGGYRLYETTTVGKTKDLGSTDRKAYGLHLDMNVVKAFELMAEEGNGGVEVVFTLASEELRDGSVSVSFDASLLTKYAQTMVEGEGAKLVFALYVNGMDKLENPDALTVTGKIVAAGVEKAITIG